jgi:hypothetical protein
MLTQLVQAMEPFFSSHRKKARLKEVMFSFVQDNPGVTVDVLLEERVIF